MGLLTSIKEKVANPRPARDSKTSEEELRNLDALIEDLFKIDEGTGSEKKPTRED